MAGNVILSEEDISRSLKRIAHEIVEHNHDRQNLLLIGLYTRGIPLAKRIAATIGAIKQQEIPVAALDFTLYRDDLAMLKEELTIEPCDLPGKVTGKRVILVDDVLCTGRSARAAIDALIDWGRPESVQLAVLVDRGHREMPIKADFVGKNIPSSLDERVQVQLKEIDGKDEVVILKSKNPAIARGNRR